MEKLTKTNRRIKIEFVRLACVASVGFSLLFVGNAFAQLAAPPAPAAPAAAEATAERVIVTGSNIPTAEETGPNPVDTYRTEDIAKLGVRSAQDLQNIIPQEAGGTVNQNIGNGGDGTIQFNLRGLLPKETLVLVDGKRVVAGSLGVAGFSGGVDINLIPFSMVDHVDILKDGASAVYGSDAIAGVVNFFLVHKFRGLEIGGTYGNTNLGASNDMGEWEAWIKAGTGDDKTDIVVIADFYERTGGLFSSDRDISRNAGQQVFWGGFEGRSSNFPGSISASGSPFSSKNFRLIPSLFFSANSPPPHSAPNKETSPFYLNSVAVRFPQPVGTNTAPGLDGNYFRFNFAAFTPALPPADRQSFYGSFTRDICDKYLTIFGDFKYVRSFFDASLAAVPFVPDPFKNPGQAVGLSGTAAGISVPISNPFNPFTVGDTNWISPSGQLIPVTTGVRFRGINDTGPRSEKFTYWDSLFDVGLKGEMGEFGDYFKTWNWEAGFRYSRNEGQDLSIGEASQPGLISALLDTNPATAFNPFLGFAGHNTAAARSAVYVTLHNSGEYELPLGYATINGDLFKLPAGPVSFALGGEYDGPRFTRDRDALNNTFQSIGSVDGQSFKVNRDVWSIYEEVRVPFTSPTWNFPGFYSFEVDFAEREEWYSNNTSSVPGIVKIPAQHSQYNAQKPKVSIRWEPLDPKWIGALTLRGSYTEAFHAPNLSEIAPAGSQNFPGVVDPFSSQTDIQIEEHISGNPQLHPEVAYEWTYGAVYSPKWIKGLTLSADFWHIDLRSIASLVDAQFIINFENSFPGLVVRNPTTGAITEVTNPSLNLTRAIVEGVDYEAIYILDSSIFGPGDVGRLTVTLNATYLSRFEFQATPVSKRIGLSGEFVSGPTFTGSLPHNRAYASVFYDGPTGTWLAGFDTGATVHFTGQYEDDNILLTRSPKPQMPRSGPFPWRARKVSAWTTLDLMASYTFNLPAPAAAEVPGFARDGGKNVKVRDGNEKNVMPVSTAEYNPCGWRAWLNNTTISLGMQNVFDFDPPFVAGALGNNYDNSLATIKGRFCYVQLKKRF